MSFKRKAEDALVEDSQPSRRTFIQQSPEKAHAGLAVQAAVITPRVASMEMDLAPAGAADQREEHSEQHEVPPSSCTDLVVYRPPPVLEPLLAAATAANTPPLAPVVLCNGQTIDLQQPNGMALVLRSLTPEQRASLRGMWDVLRDQKMLQSMLRKLPSPDQQQHDNDAVDAYKSSRRVGDQQQTAAPCIIEELHSDQSSGSDSDAGPGTATPAAAAGTGSGLNRPQQIDDFVPQMQQPAAVANGAFTATTAPELQMQQPTAAAVPSGWQQNGNAALQPRPQQQQPPAWPWQQPLQQLKQQALQAVGGSDAMLLDDAAAGQQQQQQQLGAQVIDESAPMDMDMC